MDGLVEYKEGSKCFRKERDYAGPEPQSVVVMVIVLLLHAESCGRTALLLRTTEIVCTCSVH